MGTAIATAPQRKRAGKPQDEKPKNIRIIRPSGPAQHRFLSCADREVVFNSAVGDGKTFALCAKAHVWAERYRGSKNLVVRATMKSCHQTTMDIYRREILGPALFDRYFNASDHRLDYQDE